MIQLIPITLEDQNLFSEWFASDSIGEKELSSYKNLPFWFKLLIPLKLWGWIVEENKKKIGFIDLEKDSNNIGHFSFYIAPIERNKGKSKNILLSLIKKSKELNILLLEAGVNENNPQSQKSLKSIGFTLKGKDKDGYLVCSLPINSSERI